MQRRPRRPSGIVAAVGPERAPLLELTYNWDKEDYGSGRNFGHLAFEVDDIYAFCQRLGDAVAFVRSPDNISIEILQKGSALPQREPWASMPNTGTW